MERVTAHPELPAERLKLKWLVDSATRSIEAVSEQRRAHLAQVYADLMSATGLELKLKERASA